MTLSLASSAPQPQTHKPGAPRVLLADDDRTLRLHLSTLLENVGYQVIEMADGQSTFSWLQQPGNTVDALLLDREMPGLDGLSLVRLLKQDARLATLPVIMITGADQPAQVQEGIAAGVFYYLTKPVNSTVLQAVSAAAVQESRRRRGLLARLEQHQSSYQLLESATFRCRTVAEAERLAMFLALCFPQPGRVLAGLAELLLNAVEHGLLGIGYAGKTALLNSGQWLAEVQAREARLAPTSHVNVQLQREISPVAGRPASCTVVITDPGPGFAWQSYLQLAPERASDNHGRGIAQARAVSFDTLTYNPAGNQVIASAGPVQGLEW